MLKELIKDNGFVFSENQDTFRRAFYVHTGMTDDERLKRNLTFHSIRHFFNTYLVSKGIQEIKVKSIMGHSSGKGSMTERYTNFQPYHFQDVVLAQRELYFIFSKSSD